MIEHGGGGSSYIKGTYPMKEKKRVSEVKIKFLGTISGF